MGILDSLKKMFGGASADEQPQEDSQAAPAADMQQKEAPAEEAAPMEESTEEAPAEENQQM